LFHRERPISLPIIPHRRYEGVMIMRMPIQSRPVHRGVSTTAVKDAVTPSDACSICMAACELLGGWEKTACQLACQATVC
jgi:hypothetical protein